MSARGDDGREYCIGTETHLISSKFVKQTFQVQVMRPPGSIGERAQFPVVYATDGDLSFDALRRSAYSIQTCSRAAPRFILVGIGYPSESPLAGELLRMRDMTFPGYPRLSTKVIPCEGVLMAEEGTKDFYGAEDFQRFISDELITLIDKKYPTIPGDRTYFGHSLGGGFGLFTLFNRSDLFKNYIVSSPGLMFHGKSSAGIDYDNYEFLFRDARKFIASGKPLDGTRLYMSVGTEEEFETSLSGWHLTSSFFRMAALMKAAAIPGLRLTTDVFAGKTHMTTWPVAFIQGIRDVFEMERTGTDEPKV